MDSANNAGFMCFASQSGRFKRPVLPWFSIAISRPADRTLRQGIELAEAARTYTVLTVDDGLVTLIPSLLVSVAGGILLTRANSAGLLGAKSAPSCWPPPEHRRPHWSASGRFFETTYRIHLRRGPSRAPLSESSPLSRQALAGAGTAAAGGGRAAGIPPEIRLRPLGTMR
jgi:hypothetical protein